MPQEAVPLARTQRKPRGVMPPAAVLQEGLRSWNVLQSTSDVQVVRLAQSHISVKLDGENWPLQNHDGNSGSIECLQYLSQKQGMANGLHPAIIAALLQFQLCVLRNHQSLHSLQGCPTQSGSTVAIHQIE